MRNAIFSKANFMVFGEVTRDNWMEQLKQGFEGTVVTSKEYADNPNYGSETDLDYAINRTIETLGCTDIKPGMSDLEIFITDLMDELSKLYSSVSWYVDHTENGVLVSFASTDILFDDEKVEGN